MNPGFPLLLLGLIDVIGVIRARARGVTGAARKCRAELPRQIFRGEFSKTEIKGRPPHPPRCVIEQKCLRSLSHFEPISEKISMLSIKYLDDTVKGLMLGCNYKSVFVPANYFLAVDMINTPY